MKEETKRKIGEKNKLKTKEKWKDPEYREKISTSMKKKWEENREVFSSGIKQSQAVGKSTKGKFKGSITSVLNVSSTTTSLIFKRLNSGCSRCSWKEVSCDLYHINGRKIEDADNHKNLSYLCPNCHRLVHLKMI